MITAKLFENGHSQAVRLPKAFRFEGREVEIFRRGDEVVLRPKRENLAAALLQMRPLPADFFADPREDPPAEEREAL
ncbi:MAG: type II toxin-antitoxin system VapB family antitoxin [Gammaproteobacteria bacterium]|nr:type II toxin-antitoxin system VapB family antitoxin [Gammaproteobacteria bacterium]